MEKNNQTIRLDSYSSIYLNKVLHKDIRYYDGEFTYFTLDELSSIEEISLTGFHSLEFLKYLPNLKHLVLRSGDYNHVSPSFTYDSDSFNNINTFELNYVMKFLTKLTSLEIYNDLTITKLDVSSCKDLQTLFIRNCPELYEISGLSGLRKLKDVCITGTNIHEFEDLSNYLRHTVDTESNIIDINMFFAAIQKGLDIKTLLELNLRGLIHVDFAEKNGIVGYTRLELEQVCELYERFKSYFKQRKIENVSDYEKVLYILDYIQRNITFAADELDEREIFIRNIADENGKLPKWANRYLGYLHSSYTTFKRKKGNCEGIVNLIRFILSVEGIPSENVQCNDRRSGMVSTTNHSLIRILIDGEYYYFDPSYDSKNRKKYYFMDFETASKYVDLSLYEAEKMKAVEKDGERKLHF